MCKTANLFPSYVLLLLASSKICRPNPNSHLRRRSDPNRAARGYTTTTYNTREGSSSSNGRDNTCDKPGRGDRAQLARGAMDPCAFVRLTVDQLLLKLPSVPRPSSGAAGVHPSTSPCFCTLHLQDHPSAGSHSRTAQLPLASSESPGPVAAREPVVISLDAAAVQRLSARPPPSSSCPCTPGRRERRLRHERRPRAGQGAGARRRGARRGRRPSSRATGGWTWASRPRAASTATRARRSTWSCGPSPTHGTSSSSAASRSAGRSSTRCPGAPPAVASGSRCSPAGSALGGGQPGPGW